MSELPEKFAEDWGALKTDIGYIKGKVDEASDDIKDLPCKSPQDNPVTDIANLKRDAKIIKGVGGTVIGGIILAIVAYGRKVIGG